MKSVKYILIFMLVAPGLAGRAHMENPEPAKGGPDSLALFYKSLELKAEGTYNALMVGRQHSGDRLAPEILRFFVEAFEPQRVTFSQGVSNDDGKLTFWWYMDEFAVNGTADDFHKKAAGFFKEHEYLEQQTFAQADGRITFFRLSDNVKYSVIMEPFQNYTGGPLCGGSVWVKISSGQKMSPPSTGDLLKIYPAVNCAALPDKITDLFKKMTFVNVSYGGTWENYYTWSIDVAFADEPGLDDFKKKLIEVILNIGYSFHAESDTEVVFNEENTPGGSFLFVDKETETTLNFRFQPNS